MHDESLQLHTTIVQRPVFSTPETACSLGENGGFSIILRRCDIRSYVIVSKTFVLREIYIQ